MEKSVLGRRKPSLFRGELFRNYFRCKAIDRTMTTMEIAMKAGLLTPAEFKGRIEDLLNELSEKEERK